MRFFSSPFVFHEGAFHDWIIACGDDGTIEDIGKIDVPSEKIEAFPGILSPGFINTHCHLELSHLKGIGSPGKGMADFISEVVSSRKNASPEEIQEAIQLADKEMYDNGIVAAGDICNTEDTVKHKFNTPVYYHSFLEVFDLHPSRSVETICKAKTLLHDGPTFFSIVPHAPYTVTPELFRLIVESHTDPAEPVCIHNQESQGELDFFSRKGSLYDSFIKMGLNLDWLPAKAISSLEYSLTGLKDFRNIQLVHNTYTTAADLAFINSQYPSPRYQIFLCTCPNANLFIEDKLPDYSAWRNSGLTITVGTDSYASNWSLSILDELKTIQKHFPEIPLAELLTWATINGSKFLDLEEFAGKFRKGKNPGVVHIGNIDDATMRLKANSYSNRII